MPSLSSIEQDLERGWVRCSQCGRDTPGGLLVVLVQFVGRTCEATDWPRDGSGMNRLNLCCGCANDLNLYLVAGPQLARQMAATRASRLRNE